MYPFLIFVNPSFGRSFCSTTSTPVNVKWTTGTSKLQGAVLHKVILSKHRIRPYRIPRYFVICTFENVRMLQVTEEKWTTMHKLVKNYNKDFNLTINHLSDTCSKGSFLAKLMLTVHKTLQQKQKSPRVPWNTVLIHTTLPTKLPVSFVKPGSFTKYHETEMQFCDYSELHKTSIWS